MAVAGKKIPEYTSLGAPTSNTRLVVSHNGNTYQVNVAILLGNSAANVKIHFATPANSTINVAQGTIMMDADYIYVATANNTLKRVALSSF